MEAPAGLGLRQPRDAVDGPYNSTTVGPSKPAQIGPSGDFIRGAADLICLLSRRYRADHALELLWGRVSTRGRPARQSAPTRCRRPGTAAAICVAICDAHQPQLRRPGRRVAPDGEHAVLDADRSRVLRGLGADELGPGREQFGLRERRVPAQLGGERVRCTSPRPCGSRPTPNGTLVASASRFARLRASAERELASPKTRPEAQVDRDVLRTGSRHPALGSTFVGHPAPPRRLARRGCARCGRRARRARRRSTAAVMSTCS